MAKKMTKVQAAVETLTFATPALTPSGYNGRFYIDLAKAASEVNRRFYRQGRQWMVAGFTLFSSGTGTVGINKAPVTWVTGNSWEKTFRHWDTIQRKALKDAGAQSAESGYRDFKIYLDSNHRGATSEFKLVPTDGAGAPYLQGEWEYSKVFLPGDAAYDLHLLGADTGASKGVINAYAASRAYPEASVPEEQEPELGLFALMNDLDDVTTTALDRATDRNDDTPYSRFYYPGQATNGDGMQVHAYANIIDSGAAGANLGVDLAHAPGGMFPCGLIAIDWTEAENNANLVVQVHMVPGSYRGYLAPPMTEM